MAHKIHPMLLPAPEPKTELGRYRVLCPSAGVRVSPLCLGAMSIGSAWEGIMGSTTKEASMALLDAFREAGGNFIDTSSNYQDEESEMWIGEWMEERGIRDEMVIATKFTSDFASHRMGKDRCVNHAGNHRKSMQISVRESLKKLRTDYIDILYLHWWDHTTSIREVMDGLHMLVEQGKVLYLGISDTPAWICAAANEYALAHGKTPFTVYQGQWSVMRRDLERDVLPMARHYGMAIAPWGSLGGGHFQSPKQIQERRAAGDSLRDWSGSGGKLSDDEVRFSEALLDVAREHGSESPAAAALAYVRCKAAHVFPIVGGRRIEHLRDNIAALDMRLTDEQLARLEAVKPFDVGFPANMLGKDPAITGASANLGRVAPMAWPDAHKPTSV